MIPHNRPTLGIEEEEAALRVIRSGWLSQGPEVEAFENEFCQFLGLPKGHAVAVSSGTAALFLSLWVLGGHGKKVTFPGYVCSALRHAVGMIGGAEHLIDIAHNSPNMDAGSFDRNNSDITIIPHMYGIPVDLSNCQSTNIIEDCAQALGAKVEGKSVGLQGTISIFSFYVTKLITSGGQGGMVASKDRHLVDAIRDYREFDYRHDNKKRFNFQMTDLQAAIGREQLRKLPQFLSRRAKIFDRYKRAGLDLLDIAPEDANRLLPVRYRAIIRTKNPQQMINSLRAGGIHAIVPTEEWELLGDPSLFPNALQLSRETLSLPIYPSLSDEEVEMIVSRVLCR